MIASNNNLIIVYISAVEKLNFFLRFYTSASMCGYDYKVVTHSASIKLKYPKAILISCPKRLVVSSVVARLVRDSLEGKAENTVVDGARAEGAYQNLRDLMRTFSLHYNNVLCFLWNGSTLMESIAAEVANENGIERRFFEIGNFPGKIFVDPSGVNCKASISDILYFRFHYLSDFTVAMGEEWLQKYRANAHSNHTVKQARNINKINGLYLVDWIWSMFFKPVVSQEPLLKKIYGKYKRRFSLLSADTVKEIDYIFYPCQVSSDSQLILNSDIGNIDALKLVAEKALVQKRSVVVKLHPAEPDVNAIHEIVDFCKLHGIFISDRSVPELLINASEVFTINSTVGLQSILFERPLTILGDTLYKEYSLNDLLGYILEYLLCIDYFGEDDISIELFGRVVDRRVLGGGG
jgi:capsular polysaccharide export protein